LPPVPAVNGVGATVTNQYNVIYTNIRTEETINSVINRSGSDTVNYGRTFNLNGQAVGGNVMSGNVQSVFGSVTSENTIQNIKVNNLTYSQDARGNVQGGEGVNVLAGNTQIVGSGSTIGTKSTILGASTEFQTADISLSSTGNLLLASFKPDASNSMTYAVGNTQYMGGSVKSDFVWNEDPSGSVKISVSATGNALIRQTTIPTTK